MYYIYNKRYRAPPRYMTDTNNGVLLNVILLPIAAICAAHSTDT